MAARVFDDPQYDSVDGSYDSPSAFLDQVPQIAAEDRRQQQQPPEQEQSGDYSTVDDFLDGSRGDGQSGDFSDGGDSLSEPEDGEEEQGEEGGEGRVRRKKSNRFSKIRQSQTENIERSTRIYVQGDIAPLQPMLSFKSRMARARSREELEEDGIYQGLRITDEQRQQIGIMPESIYMTVALETSRAVLENMSMEIGLQAYSRPASSEPQRQPSSVSPAYRGLVLHPPPLPPLNQGAPTRQRKCHAIIENIVKSEAAFLTSLKVAQQVYMKPLLEMSSPPIDKEQVKTLFGPIGDLMAHHELFYTALTQKSMDWGPKQLVGSVFMTFYRREVIAHYVKYVNNFTDAMATLQKNIKRKQKFVTFLEQRYRESKTSLSLQGLLLKPVQRFPQYILFLQDLIKYTPPHHPDRVTLQLALARCETIAEHLNEAKRTKEQQTIVAHLSSRVSQLPFKLSDSPNRCLLLQEQVTRLILSPQGSDNLVQHKRSLLLFNNMVMCAALNKKTNGDSRNVGLLEDAHYKCKWQSPLDTLSVVEPDYSNDIWDHMVAQDDSEEAAAYKTLKIEYMKYTQDFLTISKIASLVSALEDSYPGLKLATVQSLLRVLQRKLARTREELKRSQPGRLDVQIPSRDGTQRVHHTYLFESEKSKQTFVNNLRYATLKLKEENKTAWVCAESVEDDVIIDSVGHLPLFVESYHLTNNSECLTTECATKTHSNTVWFASCSSNTAEIAIIQSVTPTPILLKSFTVDSTRILAMCYVPRDSSSHQSSPLQSSMSSAIIGAPSLSANSETIWMGSQTGKLMIHPTSNEMAHKVMEVINFAGPASSITRTRCS
ncbi:Rho guanine nucleotide exchange factor 10 [Geodia barretti]|uniref:Rho guanine nucleotide exchange factor 10 n=1 Tax=Geodia barretti TaxID=519541 RepID=A0AA35WA15_GEOBA|nr:Rho guanine nucleotide exchange factor 10 [Geodia barretti]